MFENRAAEIAERMMAEAGDKEAVFWNPSSTAVLVVPVATR
jgi:hypothetical protein